MPHIKLSVTTAQNGTGIALGGRSIEGVLYAVRWLAGDFADGVDAVLSTVNSDAADAAVLTLTNANDDAWYLPRIDACSAAGAAANQNDQMIPFSGVPKLVISSGGDTKTGGCILYYLDL